ncbi:MAG: RDD family protein, partial [Pseudomonadota bacterium]
MENQTENKKEYFLPASDDRFAAFLVDAVIFAILYLVILNYTKGFDPRGVIAWLVPILVETFCLDFWGTTLGKKIKRLKVTSYPNYEKIGLFRAFIRTVLKYLGLFLMFVPFLPMAFSRHKRHLSDFMCATVVVSKIDNHLSQGESN